MNDVNIKSENQSGGITAQNVNTGNGTQFDVASTAEKEGRIKTIFWWIFGLAGLLAAVFSIYKFFF